MRTSPKYKTSTVRKNVPGAYSLSRYWIPSLKWKIDTVVAGKYVDSSGNRQNADAATITTENDGIKLPNHATIKEYCLSAGVYDVFYDITGTPKSVLKSQIGHIYNNIFFDNDVYIELYSEPLTGVTLTDKTTELFGAIDSDASTIITAVGVTSEFEKRLIDTHVKDLKLLNVSQPNLFKFGDVANSIIKQLHPMVGSSFDNMKFNWLNPTDLDASYRLKLWTGTSATKVLKNAIDFTDKSFVIDTCFNPSFTLLTSDSFSYYSIYDRISSGTQSGELGAWATSGGNKGLRLAIRRDASGDIYNTLSGTGQTLTETDSAHYYLSNKVSDSDLRNYRDGVQIGDVINSGAIVHYNSNVALGANRYATGNPPAAAYRTNLPCAYYHMGGGILNSIVKQFSDSVIRLISSKNYYCFSPDETAAV